MFHVKHKTVAILISIFVVTSNKICFSLELKEKFLGKWEFSIKSFSDIPVGRISISFSSFTISDTEISTNTEIGYISEIITFMDFSLPFFVSRSTIVETEFYDINLVPLYSKMEITLPKEKVVTTMQRKQKTEQRVEKFVLELSSTKGKKILRELTTSVPIITAGNLIPLVGQYDIFNKTRVEFLILDKSILKIRKIKVTVGKKMFINENFEVYENLRDVSDKEVFEVEVDLQQLGGKFVFYVDENFERILGSGLGIYIYGKKVN